MITVDHLSIDVDVDDVTSARLIMIYYFTGGCRWGKQMGK